MRTYTESIVNFFCVCCILLIFSTGIHAQFQRQFGTPLDEYFSKVIQNGSQYYVLGQAELSQNQVPRATVSLINNTGELQWTLSLDIASVWNDAVLTPSGDLLVVGNTLPANSTSGSLMGLVAANGGFTWVRSYDLPQMDGFVRIVKNPVPQNPAFPYYVLGTQTDLMTFNTDMILLNLNETGTFSWKKLYNGPIFFNGSKIPHDMEAMPNGDLLIAVNFDTQGLIMRTDNTGQGFGGVTTGFPSTFTDITRSGDGGVYAVAAGLQNGLYYMMKFDNDLIGISDVNFLGMDEVHQIIEGNGNIYVCGSKGPRQTVLKFTENNNTPALSWVKALDNGIVDQTPSTLTFLQNGQLAYADGRTVPQGGFGELCAILSISDAELNTCMTVEESGVEIVPSGILYEGPLLPDVDFYDVPPSTNIAASSSLNWQQDEACREPCDASFTINFVDNCGHIQVNSTSVGQQPLSYQWCSGESTPNLDVQLSCGPHTFCVSVTCADGSVSTASETINVIDNIAPVVVCPADITRICDEDTDPISTGFATATDNCTTIPVIAYSDQIIGNFPCEATIFRSWNATDSCGNVSSCLQQITVVDNVPPTITCPANVVVSANPPDCSATVDGIRWLNSGDNCGLAGIQYNITGAGGNPSTGNNNSSGASFNHGSSIVTYTATDDCGNTKTCSFNVTVNCEGQNQLELHCGMAVVTCFPGFNNPSDPNSQINNSAPVIGLHDIRNTSSASPGPGHNWSVPKEMFAQGNSGNIGQVFGIAIDTAGRIYTSASTIYGSAINLGAFGFQWGPGGPGGIYRFTYNSTTGQWDMDVFASLPNSGSGLGNIAYDPDNDQFFVTNHSDGLIYRIGNSVSGPGTIHPNKYNYPGVVHNLGGLGFVDLGERLWGIGYNSIDKRVYFAVWNEDNSRKLVNVSNQIFSIGLNTSGDFLAVSDQRLEVNLPNYTGDIYSNPVSDIEFSNAGRMLVAEKVMMGDFGNVASPSPGGLAHRARIFQYQGTSQSWGTPMHIHIGNAQVSPFNEHNNSAGGIDYGYQDLDDFGTLEGCDSLIWGTGDALMYNGHNNNGSSSRVYGIAGMPSSGNSPISTAPNYVESTSFYVDLDGSLGSEEKTEIGDVDIFNCVCPGVNLFCDDISVSSMTSNSLGDSCCFVLEVNNQLSNFFTGITLCSSNGVSISTISSLNGWTVAGFNSQQITVQPSTSFITTGNQTFIKFCLSNYQAVPSQQIIVKYHGPNFSVECMDTLNYECSQKPKCLKIVNDTIICSGNGQYQMDFCIMSDALIGWSVSSFELNAPAGVTFTPSVFSVIPALAPGSMRCTFSSFISGAHDGQTLCFSVTAHKQNIFNGETPLDCCTDTVMLVCVTMPTCVCNNVFATATPAQSMGDTCCWKVSLLNNYSNSFFTGIELDIITPGVVFGAINNTLSSGWSLIYGSQNSFFHKKPPGTHIGPTDMLPTFCLSGITGSTQVPQMVVLNWLGPNSEIECRDTLIFNCEPPVETDCAALVNPVIECDSINGGYNFEFQVMNNSGFSINKIQFSLISPSGSILPDHVNLSSPLAHGQTSGLLSTGIFGPAGSQVCFNLTVHELGANGAELNCCTKSQQYCFILPFCDSCCADSAAFFIAAQNVQTFGTLGDCTISFAAEGLNECMQITYFWGDGPGSQSNPITNNGVLVTHTFAGSGTYIVCYEIEEISNGYPCWSYTHCDTVDIICNSCCLDFNQFCQNVMDAVSIIVNPDSCKVTLQIGDLPECDYIEWVDWGDNMQSSGNFVAGDMPMHVYSGSGTYIISYLAIELDSSGFICFEKILQDTIEIDCHCGCGGFTDLFVRGPQGAMSQTIMCNNSTPFQLPCLGSGSSYNISGLFQCNGSNCQPLNNVHWVLTGPAPAQSGNVAVNPYFNIQLLPAYFPVPGNYSLTMSGICGNDTCTCILNFVIDCPDLCPCDVQALSNSVDQGFAIVKYPTSCKACFVPTALSDCESVEWHLNSTNGPLIGNTVGNNAICHIFPGAGTYTVVMIVTRKKSDGSICEVFTKSQQVSLSCLIIADCTDSNFPNSGFNLGAIGGGMLSGGRVDGWRAASGEPIVVEGSSGSFDAWTIQLSGNFDRSDVLTSMEPICIHQGEGMLSLRMAAKKHPDGSEKSSRPCDAVRITAQGWSPSVPASGRLALIPLDLLDSSEWVEVEIPVDLSTRTGFTTCNSAENGVFVHAVISVTNALGNTQGGEDTYSYAQIDNFCFNGTLVTSTNDPGAKKSLRIYPNPNSGIFTVELPEVATPGTRLSIIDVTGQVLFEKTADPGSIQQTMEIDLLPPGFYFLQVQYEDRTIMVEKIIKQ